MSIQTVTGKISKEKAGIITPHEHIFIELTAFFEERKLEDCENPSTASVTIDKLGILNRDPYALKDNLRIADYETQKYEILRFKKAGGSTIVDATMEGIGRNPEALKKLSEETGINIVMGTGFYVSSTHPEMLKKMDEDEIASIMIEEIENGVGDTGIKAGVIGEIGISEIFNEAERKVLRAAAIAYKHTGTSILVHINPWTQNGLEATEILLSNGVPPEKIAISHIDVENNMDYIYSLLNLTIFFINHERYNLKISVFTSLSGLVAFILTRSINSFLVTPVSLMVLLFFISSIKMIDIFYLKETKHNYYMEVILFVILDFFGIILAFNMLNDFVLQTIMLGFFISLIGTIDFIDYSWEFLLKNEYIKVMK